MRAGRQVEQQEGEQRHQAEERSCAASAGRTGTAAAPARTSLTDQQRQRHDVTSGQHADRRELNQSQPVALLQHRRERPKPDDHQQRAAPVELAGSARTAAGPAPRRTRPAAPARVHSGTSCQNTKRQSTRSVHSAASAVEMFGPERRRQRVGGKPVQPDRRRQHAQRDRQQQRDGEARRHAFQRCAARTARPRLDDSGISTVLAQLSAIANMREAADRHGHRPERGDRHADHLARWRYRLVSQVPASWLMPQAALHVVQGRGDDAVVELGRQRGEQDAEQAEQGLRRHSQQRAVSAASA